MRYLDRVLTSLAASALLSTAAANEPVQIDEWEVPYHMVKGIVHDSPPTAQQ